MVGHRAAGVARFYVDGSLDEGAAIALDEAEARHVRARRLDEGAEAELLNGRGVRAIGRIASAGKKAVVVHITSVVRVERPPTLHLFAPIADRERMLWLGEKATELGLTSWRAVRWQRSRSVSPRGEGEAFQTKLRLRMRSALTQSGNAWLPRVENDIDPQAVEAHAPPGRHYVLHQDGPSIVHSAFHAPVTIAVGPEGGFEEAELRRLVDGGWMPVSIGDATLRFETAGIAALAIARAALTAPVETPRG